EPLLLHRAPAQKRLRLREDVPVTVHGERATETGLSGPERVVVPAARLRVQIAQQRLAVREKRTQPVQGVLDRPGLVALVVEKVPLVRIQSFLHRLVSAPRELPP